VIVATIRMQVDAENRRELVQTFSSLYQPIVEERGCLGFEFYCEIGDDDTVLLMEEWESERHWRDHLQSKEFAVLLGAMSLMRDPKALQFKLLSEASGVQALKNMRATRRYELLSE
jgi:quinol monooxygenase YgiN